MKTSMIEKMPKISYWNIMTRRKPMPSSSDSEESKLGRVFSTFDLTALGVSATLGVGVYVLAGHVAKLEAGPSVILSFAIAAFASFLAGLCYAEFASRVPKSGSAYIFTYVAIGEFVAFVIGWNLLLEYIIGSASIAKGLSLYIDSLIDNAMKKYFYSIAPLHLGEFLSSYFDFFAFGGPLLLGLALAFGLRKSAGMNNIFCILNLGVVLYVVVTVIMNANLDYWRIDPSMVPEEHKNATIGAGGFFPFGFSGTIKGAATCFFGFVGFDCIATTGEEVRNPRKAVPRAILFSLVIIFLAYFGVALLTLMWPYYLLDVDAPLPHAFQEIGWYKSKWIVTIGGIIGLIASLFGAMFPLPRILYAMSKDGLIFREFGIISERFQTPVIGTLCASALTSGFAGLFDLAALVNMLSIGVLLAYTVVAISIIVLRFSNPSNSLPITNGNANESSNLLRPGYNVTTKGFFLQLFRFNSSIHPNNISMTVVCVLIACYCAVSLALALLISYRIDAIIAGETWAVVSVAVLALILLIFCLLISIQPKQTFDNRIKPFMVPIVPFLPAMSVFINIYLMLMLDCYTWIRFGIWMLIGIFVYFPSTWLYNYYPIKKQIKIESINNDLMHETNINTIEKNIESQHESSDVLSSNGSTSVIVNKTPQDENNFETIDTNSAIIILDTVLESEEIFDDDVEIESEQIQTESNAIENCHPTPAPRSSLNKNITEANEMEVEIIIVNNFENSEEPKKLKLEIINPDEMVSDIRKEIDQILEEAQEKVNAKNEVTSPNIIANDENIFQNKNFLSHLSEVLNKTPSKATQTLHRVKSTERNDSFKRSRSYHTLKDVQDVFKDLAKEEKIFKARPLLDLTIPGTPVSSKQIFKKSSLKIESESSSPGSSENISQEDVEEKCEENDKIRDEAPEEIKLKEAPKEVIKSSESVKLSKAEQNEKLPHKNPESSESKLPNFKLQSAAPSIPQVIKSSELPPENKKDFKDKLSKLLSAPPASKVLNLRPIPQPLKLTEAEASEVVPTMANKINDDFEEKEPPSTPKKTPLILLTETMARQRKLFDEVLKTIKNKSDEHANEKS